MELVQTPLQEGVLVEESTWKEVVLIPKGVGDYIGIGLMVVEWKAVVVILNCFSISA